MMRNMQFWSYFFLECVRKLTKFTNQKFEMASMPLLTVMIYIQMMFSPSLKRIRRFFSRSQNFFCSCFYSKFNWSQNLFSKLCDEDRSNEMREKTKQVSSEGTLMMCKFHIFQWNTHNASRDFCRCVYDEMVSLSSFALVFSTKTILLPLAKSEQKIKVHHKPCKVERVLVITNKKLKCTNEVTLNVSLIKLCYLLVLNMFALATEEKKQDANPRLLAE